MNKKIMIGLSLLTVLCRADQKNSEQQTSTTYVIEDRGIDLIGGSLLGVGAGVRIGGSPTVIEEETYRGPYVRNELSEARRLRKENRELRAQNKQLKSENTQSSKRKRTRKNNDDAL